MIGVFDSGVGGLTVVRHIRDRLPSVDIHYFGDRARAPYGPRSVLEVRSFSEAISSHLIGLGAETIVVACNTASAAALHSLRETFPDTAFVGMEPAVKPAASNTKSGVVGVVATAGTIDGELFESVVQRFGADVTVASAACPEWVSMIENGELEGIRVRNSVEACLEPLIAAGVDHIVLGCTHFPLLVETIESVLADRARVVDPGPAVARQTQKIWEQRNRRDGRGELVVELTGSDRHVTAILDAVGLVPQRQAVTSSLT